MPIKRVIRKDKKQCKPNQELKLNKINKQSPDKN